MKLRPQYRSMLANLLGGETGGGSFIDEENRTVIFSFSSEFPVEREFGYEILDHKPESIDLSRKGSMPFLVNHNRDKQVGIVEDVWVEDNRGYAKVRFSKSTEATDIFNDIKDGIRKTVSFGYRIMEMIREKVPNETIPTYRITRWQPFEVSNEAIPADYTVGFGRGTQDDEAEVVIIDEIETRSEEISGQDNDKTKLPVVEVKGTRTMDNFENQETGIKAERKRQKALREIADKVRHLIPDVDRIVSEYSESDRSVEDFNAAIVDRMNTIKVEAFQKQQVDSRVDLSNKEKSQYSLSRLIEGLSRGDTSKIGYELEVGQEAERKGFTARNGGVVIPFSILNRAGDAFGTAAGSAGVVATDFWGDSIIPALRGRSVVQDMGATIYDGLQGNVQIPKMSGATIAWVAENAQTTSNPYAASSITLQPFNMYGGFGISRTLLKANGLPSFEQKIADSIASDIASFLDKEALVGSNTSPAISGICNANRADTYRASAATGSYSSLTWAHVTYLEGAVGTANAEKGSLGYVTSPAVRSIMKSKLKEQSVAAGFIMDNNNTINGYKVGVTSNCPYSLIYGNWNDLLLGIWGNGVEIMVDPYKNADYGVVMIRDWLTADIKVAQNQSFAVQVGITN